MRHQQTILPRLYMDRRGGANYPNKRKPWNDKLIGRLLLTMTVADPK